jgi:threonine/homoserine/homoserine lactone efflux protein
MSVKEHYTKTHELFFFGSLLGTVFATDLLKSYVANRIKNLLKPEVMLWINRIIGVVLIGFGLNMIYKVLG